MLAPPCGAKVEPGFLQTHRERGVELPEWLRWSGDLLEDSPLLDARGPWPLVGRIDTMQPVSMGT